jgi:hypothetical protein
MPLIYQHGQVAAIAWRDGEEVLILSSILQTRYSGMERPIGSNTSENLVRALEILPLPSVPEIRKGNLEVFKKLSGIAELGMVKAPIYGRTIEGVRQGVQILFQEAIGPHDITVVEAHGADELVSWVIEYMDKLGLPAPESRWLDLLAEIAGEYISDGFVYFVFDLVNLGSEAKTIEPLVYKFRSKEPYYPLRISGIMDSYSYSQIILFLITEEKIKPESLEKSGLGIAFEGSVGLPEIGEADESLSESFKGLESVWLTVLVWRGNLGSLKTDLHLEIGFSLENLKPLIAFFVPVLAASASIGLCYSRAYRRLWK